MKRFSEHFYRTWMNVVQGIDIDTIRPVLAKHAQETGFTFQMLEWGFEHMLNHWHRDELEMLFRQEMIVEMSGEAIRELIRFDTSVERRTDILNDMGLSCARRVMMVSASTVPSAAFQDVLVTLLLPAEVIWRPASNLYALCVSLREWLLGIAPDLGSRLDIMRPDHDVANLMKVASECDVLNVSGSDQTIGIYDGMLDEMRRQGRHAPQLIRHGHRVSCIALRKTDLAALTDKDIDGMALDASVWDQAGCLSPKCIFVEQSFDACVELAHRLMHAMNDLGQMLPATGPDMSERVARNSALRMTAFDGNVVIRGDNLDVIVVHREGLRPLMFGRTLNIFPVNDYMDAAQILAPFGQAFCSRQLPNDTERDLLGRYGYNYFCTFGKMQDPPLTWIHDGIGTIKPLILNKTKSD